MTRLRRSKWTFTRSQDALMRGVYIEPWTMSVHVPEVARERHARQASMKVSTLVALAEAVSAVSAASKGIKPPASVRQQRR